MFKPARLSRIKEIILDRNQIDVQTLSDLLSVSTVTIRSDLEDLESQGFLVRTHGGAVLNIGKDEECKSDAPQQFKYDNKENIQIAKIASQLINDHESIFLGFGETCNYIAQELLSRNNLNIITCNLVAANILAGNSDLNVILTGGNLDNSSMSLSGDIFENSLRNIFVSKAFFNVAGIDMEGGFTVSSTGGLNIYRAVKKICKQMVFVADYKKFDNLSFIHIGDLTVADIVITNKNIPEKYMEHFFNNGVKVFTSHEIKPSFVRDSN